MSSCSNSLGLLRAAVLLTCSLVVLGCAQGGHGIATGDCAVATGGPATIAVSPQFRLSLGDSAIEAASRAMGLYLTKVTGPIGAPEAKKAASIAVNAAEREKGNPLTVGEKQELESRAEVAIGQYQARCEKL